MITGAAVFAIGALFGAVIILAGISAGANKNQEK